jgi:hypothetical protein
VTAADASSRYRQYSPVGPVWYWLDCWYWPVMNVSACSVSLVWAWERRAATR